jgi:glucose uptake protein
MILPSAYWITLLVLLFSMLCWGSWANTLKKSAWRFELYYLDFAIGTVLAAVLAAYTLGSLGSDISVSDNFLLAGKKQMLLGFVAGCIFNLANMLLVAAIDVAGMSVACPVGIGLALVVGVVWSFFLSQVGNPVFLFGGCALVVVAIIFAALAHSGMAKIRRAKERAELEAKLAAELETAPPATKRKKVAQETGPGAWLGIVLALIAGVLMGSFYPLVTMSMEGDLGLNNPYALALVFSIGILLSTFIYNLYFMNLPVKGLPVSFFAYFTGTKSQHLLGLLGGIIWMAGAVANFAGSAATGPAQAGPAVSYALGQGATLVSVLWGLFLWKEFAGADSGVKRSLVIMFFCFLAGLLAVAVAPVF